MPVAGALTAKQARLVDAIVLRNPESVAEAARIAGMSRENASRSLSRAVTVQRAIATRQAEQRDTARSIRKRALAKSSVALEDETDLGRLMGTAKIAADIEATLPEEAEPPDTTLRHRAAVQALALVTAGIRAGARAPHVLAVMEQRLADARADLAAALASPAANRSGR